ncbi:sterol desaturase family protein [Tenacibaculum haliotis]|uniref:sterol desaturase family protein n=1 Tax=Tenacibaculum haliotis TaxID=1888914 RepID=UPI0021AFA414|nr:sterol desaturase family protein [Tenacibaculum haliotis]MCT4698185.1 sterol desaturase family protein [Tenacibaculum haliotis]
MGLLNQDVLYFWSTPFFISIILIEIYFSYRSKKKNYDFKDTSTNVYFALINFSLDLLMKVISFGVMGICYHYKIVDWEYLGIAYWLFAFIGQDFLYYIHHYVDHHSRFFWAVHVTHHNSEYYNISTGFRSPVLQPLFRYMFFLPLAFLGVEPLHIMFAYALNQIYGTLCHTNFIKSKLGLWGFFFVTPSHHRVHHASNTKYLDKNMGMVLIIWDRMFGTFQAEEDEVTYEKLRYGLTSPLEDKGPINIIFHEWKEIFKDFFNRKKHLPLGTRLKYVFMPPGWSHDNSSKTSKELQAELSAKQK